MGGSDRACSAAGFIQAVTTFVFAEDEPLPADVIFVPGAARPEHALRAAELYHAGYAPYILPSGRYSKLVGRFAGVKEAFRDAYPQPYETEWDFLRDVLIRQGVPDAAILREDQATYTWENATCSRLATDAMGLQVHTALLCCKPFHARRALLYYQAAYPEAKILACPCRMPGYDRDDWYRTEKGRQMVLGEVSRLGGQIGEVFSMLLEEKDSIERSYQ